MDVSRHEYIRTLKELRKCSLGGASATTQTIGAYFQAEAAMAAMAQLRRDFVLGRFHQVAVG